MALFKINKDNVSKLKIAKFSNEKELQVLFEKNLEAILGIRFLSSEFPTTHGGRIDTLGIDENNAPVIVEYKESEKDNVINQGLFYIDWLVDHKGDFELLLHNKFSRNIKVNWDEARLILVAQSFNEYDKYAVNRISGNIELWKYVIYADNILMTERINLPKGEKLKEKRKISKIVFQEYDHQYHLKGKNQNIKLLFQMIRDDILKLDDQIQEKIKKYYIAFALDKNFCEIIIQSKALRVHLDIFKKELDDPKGLVEDCSEKGHWATGHSKISISTPVELGYLFDLIKQSYENAR